MKEFSRLGARLDLGLLRKPPLGGRVEKTSKTRPKKPYTPVHSNEVMSGLGIIACEGNPSMRSHNNPMPVKRQHPAAKAKKTVPASLIGSFRLKYFIQFLSGLKSALKRLQPFSQQGCKRFSASAIGKFSATSVGCSRQENGRKRSNQGNYTDNKCAKGVCRLG